MSWITRSPKWVRLAKCTWSCFKTKKKICNSQAPLHLENIHAPLRLHLCITGTSTPWKLSGTCTPTRSCRQTADRLSVLQLKLRLVKHMYPNSFLYLYIIFCICTPANHSSNNCHLSFCCPRALGIHHRLSQHCPSTSWFPYATDSCDLDLSIVFHDKYDKWNNTAGGAFL